MHIPLDSEELDAEARRWLTKLKESMTPEQKERFTEDDQKKALERIRESVYQNRVGHFQVVCQVLDSSRVIGTDVVEIEVAFERRFSDAGLAQSPTAENNRQPFSISIKTSSEQVVAGTQIDLEIKVLNTSDEMMVARSAFQAYDGDPTYEYSCHDSAGNLVSKEIVMVGSAHDPPLLKPGEAYDSTVLLNRAARATSLPSSALGKAANYTLALWPKLTLFLEYPELELSNNLAENSMRPVAIGRKNWIHIGSQQAGPKVAAILSVVETCRRRNIPVREYLAAVLPGLAETPIHHLPQLTPIAWASQNR